MRPPTATQQAVERLASEILAGRYADQPLPPERELAEKMALSRATVREVLSRLERRGLVERHQGRGTFARRMEDLKLRPLAMLMCEPHKTSSFYVSELIRGATSRLNAGSASLSITSVPPGQWSDPFVENCSGVLIVPTQVDAADVEALESLGCPHVTIADSHLPGPCIRLQLAAAAEQLTDMLLEAGHRRIGMISGHGQHSEQIKRDGIRQAIEKAGLDFSALPDFQTNYDPVQADLAASKLVEMTPRPTAIIGFDDDLAMHAISAAQRAGLRLPRDLSIVGFNDAPFADLLLPRLTTVGLPVFEAGAAAVDSVQRALQNGGRPRSRTLPYKIVLRDSVATAPRD